MLLRLTGGALGWNGGGKTFPLFGGGGVLFDFLQLQTYMFNLESHGHSLDLTVLDFLWRYVG